MSLKRHCAPPDSPARVSRRNSPKNLTRLECGTHDERVPPALAKYWDRSLADEVTHEVGTALKGSGPFLVSGSYTLSPTTLD